MVDSYKRTYLDPRTKKVEKARIAARIVATVRSLEPNGRFLKEDPHTGCWIEIGDERAWKKAGQALRESAPEIRAEREKMLRGLASAGGGENSNAGIADKLPVSTSKSTQGSQRKAQQQQQQREQQRQADPPGPRHRPNPPAREGLASRSSSSARNEPELATTTRNKNQLGGGGGGGMMNTERRQQTLEGDAELERMRQEYYQMQRMQAEQQRRMEQYQAQLAAAGALDGGTNTAATTTSAEYDRDVYNEYTKMQAGLMSGYCQQVTNHHQMGSVQQHQQQQGGGGNKRFSNQDIAAAVLDSGLLPVNSGFDMPGGLVVRGEQQIGSAAQLGLGQYHQQQQFANHQQQQQQQQQQYGGGNNIQNYHHQELAVDQDQDAFGDQHFNSCDKTVSTMSSFDVQSMDMSSLGGFSWNQSGYNMSGLISTGSRNDGGTGFHNASQRSSSNKKSNKKSSLERKLEKVNEQHRRQQMQEMQRKQAQMMMMQGGVGVGVQGGGPIDVPTAGGASWQQQQQQVPTSNRSRKYSQEHNMASLNSFGFEAIEEDDITEASYKMSNLGLSGMSGMDMTFASDILSIRSKSVPKMRVSENNNKKEKGVNRRASSTNEEHLKRHSSDGDGASSSGGGNNKPAAEVGVSSVFNQSLSSTSNTSGSSMSMKAKAPNMEDFNESFKSMEMEERSRGSGGSGGVTRKPLPQAQQRQRLPDPDGVVGGHRPASTSAGRRKDPSGGRLGTIHSSRGRPKQQHHGAVSSSHAASANAARLPFSSSNTTTNRRGSNSSLGISDPDMMLQSGLGLSSNNNMDFGVSLESLKSFQESVQSGEESWLNQYNSVENIGTDRNPWDDEDAERHHGTGSSDGTSMSEISAPRMVTTGGGD